MRLTGERAQRVVVALAILVVFSGLYLATPTGNYTYDAVSYATDIRGDSGKGIGALFHPHHLLFNGLGTLTWKLARLVTPGIDPLSALQIMNAILGGLGLAIIFLVLLSILSETAPELPARRRLAAAAATTAVVGVSFGWWVASTDGRVNIPPMSALVGSFYFAWQAARAGSWRSAAASGALAAVAALLHQSHGMFIIVVGAAAMLAPVALRRRLMLLGAAFGAFVPTIALPYIIVLRLVGAHSAAGANHWALAYAHRGVWWSFDVIGNLPKDAEALAHAALATPAGGAGSVIRTAVLAGIVLVAIALSADAFIHLRSRQGKCSDSGEEGKAGRHPRLVFNVMVVVWVVVYSAFFTVWSPGYFVFWIPVALAITLAAAVNLLAGRLSGLASPLMAVGAVALFSLNLTQHILPNMDASRNKYVTIAGSFWAQAPKGSKLVICGTGDLALLEVYVPYFSGCRVISVNEYMMKHGREGLKYLSEDIDALTTGGTRVYVLGDLLYSDCAWGELEGRYHIRKKDVVGLLKQWDRRPAFTAGKQKVFELRPLPERDH